MNTTDASHWSKGGHVTARRTAEDVTIVTHTGSGAIQNVPLVRARGDTETNRWTVTAWTIAAAIRDIHRNRKRT